MNWTQSVTEPDLDSRKRWMRRESDCGRGRRVVGVQGALENNKQTLVLCMVRTGHFFKNHEIVKNKVQNIERSQLLMNLEIGSYSSLS